MIMSARSYKIAYRSHAVSQLHDPDDIATALADLYLSTSEDYTQYKFERVKKSFEPNDLDTKGRHETARPLLIGLNADTLEIIEQWPNLEDQEKMVALYNQARRGKNLPGTPLNELNTKLSNIKRVVEYMKEAYPLVIRRSFFYQDHKLFIDQLKPIPFRPYTDVDILLGLLFKNPFRVWPRVELEKILIKKRPTAKSTDPSVSFGKPLKNCIEYINSQISKKHNDFSDHKIVSQDNGLVSVNTQLFHVVDRLNRKQ